MKAPGFGGLWKAGWVGAYEITILGSSTRLPTEVVLSFYIGCGFFDFTLKELESCKSLGKVILGEC